jgi:hypothetical protein
MSGNGVLGKKRFFGGPASAARHGVVVLSPNGQWRTIVRRPFKAWQ